MTGKVFISRKESGVDKVFTPNEYENALESKTDLDKKIVKLSSINDLAYKDFILSINANSTGGQGCIWFGPKCKNDWNFLRVTASWHLAGLLTCMLHILPNLC